MATPRHPTKKRGLAFLAAISLLGIACGSRTEPSEGSAKGETTDLIEGVVKEGASKPGVPGTLESKCILPTTQDDDEPTIAVVATDEAQGANTRTILEGAGFDVVESGLDLVIAGTFADEEDYSCTGGVLDTLGLDQVLVVSTLDALDTAEKPRQVDILKELAVKNPVVATKLAIESPTLPVAEQKAIEKIVGPEVVIAVKTKIAASSDEPEESGDDPKQDDEEPNGTGTNGNVEDGDANNGDEGGESDEPAAVVSPTTSTCTPILPADCTPDGLSLPKPDPKVDLDACATPSRTTSTTARLQLGCDDSLGDGDSVNGYVPIELGCASSGPGPSPIDTPAASRSLDGHLMVCGTIGPNSAELLEALLAGLAGYRIDDSVVLVDPNDAENFITNVLQNPNVVMTTNMPSGWPIERILPVLIDVGPEMALGPILDHPDLTDMERADFLDQMPPAQLADYVDSQSRDELSSLDDGVLTVIAQAPLQADDALNVAIALEPTLTGEIQALGNQPPGSLIDAVTSDQVNLDQVVIDLLAGISAVEAVELLEGPGQ